jgi:murein DD-endopeptidase MepM/ murein hydrolase activator NlpD
MNITIKLALGFLLAGQLWLLGCRGNDPAKPAVADSLKTADSDSAAASRGPVYSEGEILPGQGIFQALMKLNVDNAKALKIVNVLRFNVELTNLRAGEKIRVRWAPDSSQVLEFIYEPNPVLDHILTWIPDSGTYGYTLEKLPTVTSYRLVKGTIEAGSSLNDALLGRDVPSVLTQVVNGILLCKISFRSDARKGDSFTVLYEEEVYKGHWIDGSVLYTAYTGRRTGFHEAYRYHDEDPKSSYNAHYTPKGEALVHSGLRFPVDRIHITSGYGMRYHPITGRRAMHFGVDYKGKVGAPVYAVAAGTVVLSKYDRLSGNKIAIRHRDKSTSYYLHLSKRAVGRGARVRARQIIGRIGRTGRVTGSHLHFGFKNRKGKWMNPLRKRMIATPKLAGARLKRLKAQMEKTDKLLDYFQNRHVSKH